jgi:hypothetical protein
MEVVRLARLATVGDPDLSSPGTVPLARSDPSRLTCCVALFFVHDLKIVLH